MTIDTKVNAPLDAMADARAIGNAVMAEFEALKATNDARAVDPVLEGKLKKIEQSLDRQRNALERLALEQSRPAIGDDPRNRDPGHKSVSGANITRAMTATSRGWI
jgi:predicted phage gp36 major capsid-like protein